MDENFHKEFISKVKRPTTTDSNIFTAKGETDKETIVEENYALGDNRTKDIQNKLIFYLRTSDKSNLFQNFFNKINEVPQDNSQSVTQKVMASKDTPAWVKTVFAKHQDKLPPIYPPSDNLDRISKQNLFNEVITWVFYSLMEDGLNPSVDLRELRDVLIPNIGC
ncbi:ORF-105 [Teiidae poxvirus 1]|nr:ORF-105 [Teiidae poxvirus 1]